jgi:transporter family protein
MSWITLAFISIVTTSFSTLIARVMMKDKDSNPIATSILFQFMLCAFVAIFTFMLGKFEWIPADVSYFRSFLSALLWAGSTFFSFKAIKVLGAGETTIIISSSAIVSIILGVVFLGEILTFQIILGFILILGAVFIVNSDKLTFGSRQGVIFSLLVSVFSGAAVVNDAYILKSYDAFSFTTIMSFLPGVILALAFPRETTKIKKLLKGKSIGMMLILTFLYAIQAVSYYLAYQNGAPISTLATLTKASIVLTVILGAIFLRERSNLPKKAVAALMVTIGAILLS